MLVLMDGLRKFGLAVVLILYIPLLLLLPAFYSLNATIIKPEFVKKTLVDAEVYEGISSFIVEQASKNSNTAGNTVVIASIQQVTTPAEMQKLIEPAIDGIYTWLDNPESEFNVKIDIQPLKANFMQIMEQNLLAKLGTLPNCASRNQVTTDPFSMTCLPPGTTPEQILVQTKAEIEKNGELLGEEQNINLGEGMQPAEETLPAADQSASPDQAIKETPKFNTSQLKIYAKVYRWIKVGTPVVIALTLIATAAIVLLSKPKHKGLRRAGITLVVSGVILLISSVGTGIAVRALLPTPATGGSLSASGTKAADIIIKKVVLINNRFTILYLVVGVIAIISAVIIGKKFKGKDTKPSIEKDDMMPKEELEDSEDKPSEKPEAKPQLKEEKPESPKETKINVS